MSFYFNFRFICFFSSLHLLLLLLLEKTILSLSLPKSHRTYCPLIYRIMRRLQQLNLNENLGESSSEDDYGVSNNHNNINNNGPHNSRSNWRTTLAIQPLPTSFTNGLNTRATLLPAYPSLDHADSLQDHLPLTNIARRCIIEFIQFSLFCLFLRSIINRWTATSLSWPS